jgi:hypothetical protein
MRRMLLTLNPVLEGLKTVHHGTVITIGSRVNNCETAKHIHAPVTSSRHFVLIIRIQEGEEEVES